MRRQAEYVNARLFYYMAHYVYILYSPNYDKYYVGESSNPAQRLDYHNELSDTSWSRNYRPWELKRVISMPDYSTARRLETRIKKKKSKEFVHRLTVDEELVKWLYDQIVG
ncbi:MAG: GIY-YIG nuclease family protein [Bacteroidota bacterium]